MTANSLIVLYQPNRQALQFVADHMAESDFSIALMGSCAVGKVWD